ncbi:Na(+)/H(+) antiporter subunit B [Synechococcus sp. PCC 6312]|uniref:Na(+)/H(+) antiporter subunit B n=1 Tax=Synechococcus sp. (strain ATCC 27167 / PCC 6312) TaxID=195253 RepID=UPI00029EE119|nr:Na(+)/H(+) antiporter subunit B [Synechococcus sp. PCC 6312]AFY62066.1 multisubunit Na+/H+ antiporter, MnhB subunit [Synechococcus sp. PCC 6312]
MRLTITPLKLLYCLAGLGLSLKVLWIGNPVLDITGLAIVKAIAEESGVPNAVTGLIFRNRLHDTMFEVLVFTIAIMGAGFLLANETPLSQIYQFRDQPSIVLARLGATISALVSIELAIRGHLSPGGGFAAGVAGGTAIGLVALISSPERLQSFYQRWHIGIWEKLSVLVFIVLAAVTLMGWELPPGELGGLVSGGIIPILNMLVAFKVALGSWAAILIFIRYRGLL